jgi:AraC-like DNA-binding protein
METMHSVAFGDVPGAEPMQVPEAVAAMLRLKTLRWGTKRIAQELGCSRMTVKRHLRQGGWSPYRSRQPTGVLLGLQPWLRERFLRQRGCRAPGAAARAWHRRPLADGGTSREWLST